MTTYFPFAPSASQPFTFQPILDGAQYIATVLWNLFGQRYYLRVDRLDGETVFTLPVIGSPAGVAIESASWAFGTVTMTTADPHGYAVGQTLSLTISGMLPNAYNGIVLAFIVDPVTFSYSLAANPTESTQLGQEIYNVNLAAGYFDSVLVYRAASQTFEVD